MNRFIVPVVIIIAALVVIGIFVGVHMYRSPGTEATSTQLQYFSSQEALDAYVNERISDTSSYGFDMYGSSLTRRESAVAPAAMDSKGENSLGGAGSPASDYSLTNIQVAGVDEPDVVKNDGRYIYSVHGNSVIISEVFPPEQMRVVSIINVSSEGASISNIFVKDDSLVILGNGYEEIENDVPCPPLPSYNKIGAVDASLMPRCGSTGKQLARVWVYDIRDRAAPHLAHDVSSNGYLVDARLIDDSLYFISQDYIESYRDHGVMLPSYRFDGDVRMIAPGEIGYFGTYDSQYVFTGISVLDLSSGNFDTKVFLTGSTGALYVSSNTVYLTGTKWLSPQYSLDAFVEDVVRPLLPDSYDKDISDVLDVRLLPAWQKQSALSELIAEHSMNLRGEEKADFDARYQKLLQSYSEAMIKESQKTIVHAIDIKDGDILYRGQGTVPGFVLNQFSMDEHEGYFRIATTSGETWSGTSLNHLYVLNDDLEIVGSVEDLAHGERIYSTRFVGDRAYMVTYRNTDPLFVIDLHDAENPTVLGYLKVTGYSDYLHPLDATHILGIGKEASGGTDDFSYYQGLKLSVFDVSDVAHPVESAHLEIGDRGTNSDALYDHKAFVYDAKRGVLLLPISVYEIKNTSLQYPGQDRDSLYGEEVWQGAYVLNVSLSDISVLGRITHRDNLSERSCYNYTDYPSGKLHEQCYWDYATNVRRSVWMDNFIYTISDSKIKANDFDHNLDEVGNLPLPRETFTNPILYEASARSAVMPGSASGGSAGSAITPALSSG